MTEHAARAALTGGFAQAGDDILVMAGIPFGRSGTTNLLHVTRITGAE
jgi:pyruvate kinase